MITYKKPRRINLFGGGRTMWEFYAWLIHRGYSVYAYTATRQVTPGIPEQAQIYDDLGAVVFGCFGDCEGLAICFGPAWPIPESLRQAYGNRLIDFMSIPYPSFLGGAHETWAELIGQKTWGCCLQLVTENTKQGECHDGQVIDRAEFPYEERMQRYLQFLQGFITRIERGQGIHPAFHSEAKPSFFPRLNTGQNGWIDWSWSGQAIFRFINAFSAYGGAGTYCGNHEIRITKATQWTSAESHPYCAGLVISVNGSGYRIACRDSHLVVQCGDMLKPGDRLHTDREKLEEALLYRPEYDAKGDAAMNALTPGITTGSMANYLAIDPLRIQLLKPDDVTQVYVDWLNDPEVNRYLEVRHSKWTRQRVEMWVSDQVANPDVALFGIYLHERHIGNIKIGPANRHHHYADLSYLIGERDLWGRGYATKAVKLAIGWAWKQMKLHRLQAGIYEGNNASEKILSKNGFFMEGNMRNQLLLNGKWVNHFMFALINPDWKP